MMNQYAPCRHFHPVSSKCSTAEGGENLACLATWLPNVRRGTAPRQPCGGSPSPVNKHDKSGKLRKTPGGCDMSDLKNTEGAAPRPKAHGKSNDMCQQYHCVVEKGGLHIAISYHDTIPTNGSALPKRRDSHG